MNITFICFALGTEASEERHPLRIDSDPEPEQEEKPDSPEESEPVGEKAVSREGRKRAVKTVVKTYEDEDGFVGELLLAKC